MQLKGLYVKAAVSRNTVGVALIDRNDELCILYEKVNLQEQTIKCGELGIRQKDRDIRMLKLQLSELQRQAVNSRKQLPQVPALVDTILELRRAWRKNAARQSHYAGAWNLLQTMFDGILLFEEMIQIGSTSLQK